MDSYDRRVFAIIGGIVTCIVFSQLTSCAQKQHEGNRQVEIEAIKAGLVQKRSSGGTTIWTKPNTPTDLVVEER